MEFGAARIGAGVPLDQIESLLDSLIDLGITFIDTADCYARSEELIGRYLGNRIGEFVIATKCGCITDGDEGEAYSPRRYRAQHRPVAQADGSRVSRSRLPAHLFGRDIARRRGGGCPTAGARRRQGGAT